MSDLVVFAGILGLVVVSGIVVGMIVAGRIDRIMAPGPVRREETRTEEEDQP